MDYDTTSTVPSFDNDHDFASLMESNDIDTNSTSVFSNIQTKNKNKPRNDDECRFLKKKINGVFVKIPCFPTKSIMGVKIRDPTNGIYYDYFVGKNDEDLFFKMRDVTGTIGTSKSGNDLYFHSPSHCERYLNITLPLSVKTKWTEKTTKQQIGSM
jgi:hypothetical protein